MYHSINLFCFRRFIGGIGWTHRISRSIGTVSRIAHAMLSVSSNIIPRSFLTYEDHAVTWCMQMHQVTAWSLYVKKDRGLQHMCLQVQNILLSLILCRKKSQIYRLTFTFCSQNQPKWQLIVFIKTLLMITSWMFWSSDHHNFDSWLLEHSNEISQMQLTHQDVYKEFLKGKFKVEMSIRKFSRIAANENHE